MTISTTTPKAGLAFRLALLGKQERNKASGYGNRYSTLSD